VSESSISASLEAMVVVLLKEISRDGEVTEKLLNSSYDDFPEHPLAIPISRGPIPLLA